MLVVGCDYAGDDWHGAIAQFQGISVADFVQTVMWWETLVNYSQEFTADICQNI